MPGMPQMIEGRAAMHIPSIETECKTYYKVFGDLDGGRPPVLVVHGGPGSGHNYLLAFRMLWDRFGLPVVFYDVIGTGQSTHLRYKKNDKSFWTMDLLVQQLESLVEYLQLAKNNHPGYYILGHSAGGWISSYFATRRPQGLKRLVLANAPGSADLHVEGLKLCWKELPETTQQAFEEALQTRDWKKQSYLDAITLLKNTNWCRADPYPEELEQSAQNQIEDNTVTESMYGESPCEVTGSLKGWNCYAELPQINVPTLLYHGEWDIERDEVVAPYVEHIPGIRKIVIQKASHMSHLDNDDCQERVISLVGSFLLED